MTVPDDESMDVGVFFHLLHNVKVSFFIRVPVIGDSRWTTIGSRGCMIIISMASVVFSRVQMRTQLSAFLKTENGSGVW